MKPVTESTLQSLFTSKKRNTRNIAIVGTKDSGVSTLKNFLFRNYGVKPNEGFKVEDVDSGNIQLIFEDTNLISVNDAQSLCDKDGLLIVVDVTKKQLDSTYLLPILKDALCLKLKLIWFFNKIDKSIFESSIPTSEELYQLLVEKIDQLNALLEQVADQSTEGGEEVSPLKSNVLFGSAVDGWAFSLEHFAKEYGQKLHIEPSKMIPKLWGENYYDHQTQTWSIEVKSTSRSLRSFCSFILDPIWKIYHSIREGDNAEKIIHNLNIQGDFKNMTGRLLLRNVMYTWLNSARITAKTVVQSVPSYQVGLLDYQRHTVFSNFLSEKTQDSGCILSIFGQDQAGNKLVKVLKKGTSKAVETWNVFKSDLFEGQTLIGKETIPSFNLSVVSKVNMAVSWEDIQEGDVVSIQSKVSQIGYILTDLPAIPFFKSYLPNIPSNKSSINSEKIPFSVSNILLGTLSSVSMKLGDLLIRKNENFETKKELLDHLQARYDFTPQDAESVVNIQNGCVVINYADSNVNQLLSSAFSKAINSTKLFFLRIEIETIAASNKLTEQELLDGLVQELHQYGVSKQ